MRAADLKIWTLSVVDRVQAAQQLEDAHVEAQEAVAVEDPQDSTDKSLANANAASGEPILWIIGLDEKA